MTGSEPPHWSTFAAAGMEFALTFSLAVGLGYYLGSHWNVGWVGAVIGAAVGFAAALARLISLARHGRANDTRARHDNAASRKNDRGSR